ncbi:MAG: hypothetical protein BWY85_02196 [Firmicutes bacterium ADurb.Bin506]|nr:MAG: hypothetical protein BWY85_02196 [Firmicutes bacterium ADurb.Bin506]
MARDCGEFLSSHELETAGLGATHNGISERMLRAAFSRGRKAQELVSRQAGAGTGIRSSNYYVGDLRPALGDGAGLVEHHDTNSMSHLQRLAAFEQDAVLGSLTGAHHYGSGSGQA